MPANAGYIIDVPGDGPEVYTLNTMHISGPQLTELTEVIEDTIEYFCDKEQVVSSPGLLLNALLRQSWLNSKESSRLHERQNGKCS